jgi:hypothetical protein
MPTWLDDGIASLPLPAAAQPVTVEGRATGGSLRSYGDL